MILHTIDYVILGVYFSIVLTIGALVRKKISSSDDFLTGGHSVPLWITSLAFISANLGAQELVGMCASGAKYGLMTVHFYWGGAIPAMVFVGLFMMPFYYGSRARSVPEYLKLRFDEKTRAFNALTFAGMTIFSSGISMYALGLLLQVALGWSFTMSVLVSAAVVLVYTFLGGLTGAIYNEVLQFFLVVLGFAPMAVMAISRAGGWAPIRARIPEVMSHAWRYSARASENPMGVEAFGLVFGLGFVLAFGYWCTDFLVLQRAMAARSMNSARLTPIIAAFPKMAMPFIVVLPGIAAVAISHMALGYTIPLKGNGYDYDRVLFTLMTRFYPSGLLGLGLTALMASFMSGMAGNVTAFNTVWTYDLYQSYVRPNASDAHYLWVARVTTVAGIFLSVGTAFIATQFNNLMDFLQLVFGVVNAPLFATFLLGMFWKRSTGTGAFTGLVAGTTGALLTHGLTAAENKGGWIAVVHTFPSTMGQNFWIAIIAWCTCFVVTVLASLVTRPRPLFELKGLVYGFAIDAGQESRPWYRRPAPLGAIALAVWLVLNIAFY